jgi:hypothetical protein
MEEFKVMKERKLNIFVLNERKWIGKERIKNNCNSL